MSTTSAAQAPAIPQPCLEREQSDGRARRERGEHRPHQVAAVARADQDAVQRKDGPVQRLHQGEQRPQGGSLVECRRIAREDARHDVGEQQHRGGERAAERNGEPDHPRTRGVGLVAAPRAERPPHDHLTGDRDRVEHERDEDPELERDLVSSERGVAEPGGHGAHDDE